MSAIVKLSDRFTETQVDDEIVIMRLDNGDFFTLVDTAADIWRLIDGKRDPAMLVHDLAGAYHVDEERVVHEVDEFLRRLMETGLLGGQ